VVLAAYGRVEPTTTCASAIQAPTPFLDGQRVRLDRRNPVADVAWTPVWAEGGVVAHAAAIRITRAASVDHVLFAEPRT